jgi:hypothetical protein
LIWQGDVEPKSRLHPERKPVIPSSSSNNSSLSLPSVIKLSQADRLMRAVLPLDAGKQLW